MEYSDLEERLREFPCCPGAYFRFSNALSYPKIGSPNDLDFLVRGPVYHAILFLILDLRIQIIVLFL